MGELGAWYEGGICGGDVGCGSGNGGGGGIRCILIEGLDGVDRPTEVVCVLADCTLVETTVGSA